MRGIKNIILKEALEGLEEFPRKEKADYPLGEILFTVFAGVLCGATTYADMAQLAMLRPELYQEYFPFRTGSPDAWTLHDVVSRLESARLQETFDEWMVHSLADRRSAEEADQKKADRIRTSGEQPDELLQVICVSSSDDALVLGQTHGSSTSADISLVLELLQILDMTDATVTLGAAGVRRATAGVLFDRGADLVLTVEEYRKAQYKELTECFSRLLKADRGMSDGTYVELRDEGEILECWLCSDMDALPQSSKWKGVRGVAMIRQHTKNAEEKIQYVMFTRAGMTPEEILRIVRNLHGNGGALDWILDVRWHDEDSRMKTDHTAKNLNDIRRTTIKVLRELNDQTTRLRGLQQYCLLSDHYFNAAIELAGFAMNS